MSIDTGDESAIEFLRGLVAISSVSTQERAAVEYMVETMAALGFDAEIDVAGNAVGRLGEGVRSLLLLGHIDTVPGEIPVRRERFGERDVLYGRGTVDAKGPLAAFVLAAARAAQENVLRDDFQIVVVGAVEEEAATSKGAYHVVETYPPADYVVIGEPSGWSRVTLGYKGRLLLDYRLERGVSHTAGQQRGVAEEAVEFWLRVRGYAAAYNADREGTFATLDPSLRWIRSESDGLVEWAEMSIGLRLPLGLDVDALVREATTAWRGDAQVSTRGYELPFRAEKRTPLTGAFLSAIRAEGEQATFVTKTGTSDMNVIGPRWNAPIVAYGPGDSNLDHTPNEHIDLGEYLKAIRVLTRVLGRLAAQGS
ncbi:MAG: [LysW]-lysine hydrolase [Chloroflexi bacterium]|nr:[LysW]-lysine hydrolase [Chloroflexota bacterium]